MMSMRIQRTSVLNIPSVPLFNPAVRCTEPYIRSSLGHIRSDLTNGRLSQPRGNPVETPTHIADM